MKHTKGPWKHDGRGDGNKQLPIRANGKIIAALRDHDTLANAKLIAAAPKMYDALVDIYHNAYDPETPIEDIKADFDRMRDIAYNVLSQIEA